MALTQRRFRFNYQRFAVGDSSGKIKVEVSADGGSHWAELDVIRLDTTDSGPVAVSYDITEYAGMYTQIRFRGDRNTSGYRSISIDNVSIEYQTGVDALVSADDYLEVISADCRPCPRRYRHRGYRGSRRYRRQWHVSGKTTHCNLRCHRR